MHFFIFPHRKIDGFKYGAIAFKNDRHVTGKAYASIFEKLVYPLCVIHINAAHHFKTAYFFKISWHVFGFESELWKKLFRYIFTIYVSDFLHLAKLKISGNQSCDIRRICSQSVCFDF